MLAVEIYARWLKWRGNVDLASAIHAGMIAKDCLVDGAMYEGYCRNADKARWDANRGVFVIQRTKFGSTFEEDVDYPSDAADWDVFCPVKRVVEVDDNT